MDLEQKAIARIKSASEMSLEYYGQPLICTYSGGKDSDVILELFRRSGVPFEVQHNHTTVDAPPTVYHVRQKFRELELSGIKTEISMPYYQGKRISMWSLIPLKRIPPTRLRRYCCQVLKETGGANRFIATGVRWDESLARSARSHFDIPHKDKEKRVFATDEIMLSNDNDTRRQVIEHCMKKAKMVVNPIIEWTNADVWDYIRSTDILYNPLYDNGYHRVGCVGCPMVSKGRRKEFADFPPYKNAYIMAFQKMLKVHRLPKSTWKTGEDVFRWWMEDKNIDGQMDFMDFPGLIPGGETEY